MQHFIHLGFEGLLLLPHSPALPFCHGEAPGLADICLVPQVYNARRWGVEIDRYPRLAAIARRAGALAAFAVSHPDAVKATV